MDNVKTNTNILLVILSYIVTLFYDLLYGLKFVTFDILKFLFDAASGKVNLAYNKSKNLVDEEKKESAFVQLWNKLPYVKKQREKDEQLRIQFQNTLDNEARLNEPTVFKFRVKNSKGRYETGTIISTSKRDVNAFLMNEGYTVYSVETSKMISFLYGSSSILSTHITNRDLIFWLTQLSTYLRAGITLVDGVRILSNQLGKNKGKKHIFDAITYELVMGNSFSGALEKLGGTFPALVINMVKAAEATGELEETLDDLANYYTEVDKTRKQMVSAATYPAVITTFATGVIVFILLYVIPKFVTIYDSANVEINGLTATIINVSNFLREYWIVILLVVVISLLTIFVLYKRIKEFRRVVQVFLMHIPVVKDIIIFNELTIFTKTFASLLKNNVFITDSIDILSRVTRNEIYKEIMYNTINNIASGDKISEAFKNHWAIPDVAYFMIVTGESTGELATMMQKVSEYYQEMHRNIVNNLKSFIEPIMITSLAVIVGIIILAVIVPMFDLYGNIS